MKTTKIILIGLAAVLAAGAVWAAPYVELPKGKRVVGTAIRLRNQVAHDNNASGLVGNGSQLGPCCSVVFTDRHPVPGGCVSVSSLNAAEKQNATLAPGVFRFI